LDSTSTSTNIWQALAKREAVTCEVESPSTQPPSHLKLIIEDQRRKVVTTDNETFLAHHLWSCINQKERVQMNVFQPPSRKMTAAENAVATSESSASAAAELSLAARALEDG